MGANAVSRAKATRGTDVQSRFDTASAWALGAALSGAALAVGTVYTSTLCIVSLALAASAVLAWWKAEPASMRQPATLLVMTCAALTAYTVLQCVPLPIAWLRVLAPHNADVWSRALAPLHEAGPSWAPLSLDPTATRVEALKGVAYGVAFVTALRIARRRAGVGFLAGVLVVTGLVLAVAALLHPAFGAHKLYGLVESHQDFGRHLAPFLNPNNLASYINIAFCLALAAALAPEPRVPRPIVGAAVVLLAATQIWIASRGGVATMFLGAALVIVIMRAGRTQARRSLATASLVAGVALAAGACMIVLGGSEDAASELNDTDASKLALFAEAMRMWPAYPLFGVGRGAFESAFPAFRTFSGFVTVAYPENVVAQWILEWGAPLGALGLVALAYGLRPNAVLARSTNAAGAWAAIATVAVQNLVDLGSEVAGLALATVACGALVVGGSAGRAPRWTVERWARAPRMVAAICAGCTVAAVAFAATGIGHELDDDRRTLERAAEDSNVGSAQIRALARAAMLRHPAEPYLPFAVAVRAVQAGDGDALDWIGATFERAKVYSPAHLLLARYIARRAPSQARLEYRLALEQAPETQRPAVMEAIRWIGGYDDALEVVPEGKRGVSTLELLANWVQLRLPATSAELDQEALRRDPNAPGPALRAATGLVADAETDGAPWCEGAARVECVRNALAASNRAIALAPNTCAPYALHARAQLAAGNQVVAVSELLEASDRVTDRVECLRELAVLAIRAHDDTRANEAVGRIVNAGCSQDSECADNLAWAARMEEQRGNHQHARLLYKQAYERTPDQDSLLEAMARLAAAGGLHAEAAEDYARLSSHHPGDPGLRKAADRERDAALRSVLQL
jgi:tetratricopeptide (TPR) repeat protein